MRGYDRTLGDHVTLVHWERERLVDYVGWAERVAAGCRGVNPGLDELFDETSSQARAVL